MVQIVSERALAEIRARQQERAPRVAFLMELQPGCSIRVVIEGEWHEDMASALTEFIARRQHRSAPVVETSHNFGEGLPSSDAAEAGADPV